MPTITFVHPDARAEAISAAVGDSVMQAAIVHSITGVVAECGGNAMCATCHVYVDSGWSDRLPTMTTDEDALLDGTAAERRPTSRLSCQIRLTPELDGLVLHLPDRQV
jgi:2Fe-2S ferredoxin